MPPGVGFERTISAGYYAASRVGFSFFWGGGTGLLWTSDYFVAEISDNKQHSQQTNMHAPGVGFERTISAGERPQTYALDRSATGTGSGNLIV